MSFSVGQVIKGKYRVVRLIGDGGMGSVYEARHEILGSRVALKSLHPELVRGGFGERFLQEAQAAARIQSPHVVRVSDVDRTDDGLPFMVLEYLEGRTLQTLYQDMYQEGKRLSYADALDFAMQLFEGVEAAHEAGVIHRDLKPDNVMITTGPRGTNLLKLLDFGIAKLDEPTTGSRRNLTRPGTVMGTPQYMAPEQVFTAGAVDARADIFALGVIVYEMLAGRRPVGGSEPQEIAVSYLTGAIANILDLMPDLAPDLAAAVHRALAVSPTDRFPTVRAFRDAVEPFALAVRPPSMSLIGSSAVMSGGSVPSLAVGHDAAASGPRPRGASFASGTIDQPMSSPVGGPKVIPATWVRGKDPTAMLPDSLPAPNPRDVTAFLPESPQAPPARGAQGTEIIGTGPTRLQEPTKRSSSPSPVSVRVTASPIGGVSPEWPGAMPLSVSPGAPLGPAPMIVAPAANPALLMGPPPAPKPVALIDRPVEALEPRPPAWPYGPTAAPIVPTNQPPNGGTRVWLFVLLGVVFLAVAGAIGGLVYYYYYDDEPEPTRPRPAPSAPRRPVPRPAPSHGRR